jgi:Origin of replication binding protein/Primase C terminal 2 (PriCT-2)
VRAVAPATVIDTAVYTSFRSFRLLTMTKFGRDARLCPIMGSSPAILAHMVGVYTIVDHGPTLDLTHLVASASYARRAPRPATASGDASTRGGASATLVPDAVSRLAKRRASDYDPWMRVGFALFNTSPTTLDAWLRFSALSPSYDRDGCLRLWRTIGVGSATRDQSRLLALPALERWAREDQGQAPGDGDGGGDASAEPACTLGPDASPSTRMLENDAVFWDTLHTQQNGIAWDDDHETRMMQGGAHAGMRRLLIRRGIVCIRANMGAGKTKALADTLERLPAAARVLVVTFGIALADKLCHDFNARSLGFANYRDLPRGAIRATRVVVCLDSFLRVPQTADFDVIVADEVVSVLEHFDSPHMAATSGAICCHLEVLLTRARTIYFLDATVDCTIVVGVVEHLQTHANKPVF